MTLTISSSTLRFLRQLAHPNPALSQSRLLITTTRLRSGHSKWATIKHDKARADNRKNKTRNLLARDIVNVTRLFGADPRFNPKLSATIAAAKTAGMSKATIDSAVLRGQGKSASGAPLEGLVVEAMYGREKPVAMIVEADVESKAMALQEIRNVLKKEGAVQTPTSFLFDRRGRVTLARREAGEELGVDEVMESVIDVEGVVDVKEDEDGRVVVDTVPDALKAVERAVVERMSVVVERVEYVWDANGETVVKGLDGEAGDGLEVLTDKLEEYPGVQKVWTNVA